MLDACAHREQGVNATSTQWVTGSERERKDWVQRGIVERIKFGIFLKPYQRTGHNKRTSKVM